MLQLPKLYDRGVTSSAALTCTGRLNGGLTTAAAAAADNSGRNGALLHAASSAESTMRSANSAAFSDTTASGTLLVPAPRPPGESQELPHEETGHTEGGSPTSALHVGAPPQAHFLCIGQARWGAPVACCTLQSADHPGACTCTKQPPLTVASGRHCSVQLAKTQGFKMRDARMYCTCGTAAPALTCSGMTSCPEGTGCGTVALAGPYDRKSEDLFASGVNYSRSGDVVLEMKGNSSRQPHGSGSSRRSSSSSRGSRGSRGSGGTADSAAGTCVPECLRPGYVGVLE